MKASTLTKAEAAAFLVGQAGLRAPLGHGADGIRALIASRRCIQLDPLDKIGTNADLVAMARVDGLKRGDVYRHLMPGHAFEHFAKERCLIPASRFPDYRGQAAETPWWRQTERLGKLPDGILGEVLAEVQERGPLSASALTHRGQVVPIDWSGWMGTSKAATMALEVLWSRCQVVVCARKGKDRLYDVPSRALPEAAAASPAGDFDEVCLLDRIEAAGLLSSAAGPHWSTLSRVRTGPLPKRLVAEGRAEAVTVEGAPRVYYAPAGFRERTFPEDDGRMRILGPLDPLIWDRGLIRHAFGFDYVWEVYKPAAQRKWGWYVVPLLHRGALVGRLEAHVEKGELVVDNLWKEDASNFDDTAFRAALERHAEGLR
jgi:uncharacterized protein YcaQ